MGWGKILPIENLGKIFPTQNSWGKFSPNLGKKNTGRNRYWTVTELLINLASGQIKRGGATPDFHFIPLYMVISNYD